MRNVSSATATLPAGFYGPPAPAAKAPRAPRINSGLPRANPAFLRAEAARAEAAELAELSALATTPAPVYSAPEAYGPPAPAADPLAEYGPEIYAPASRPVRSAKAPKAAKAPAPAKVSKGINLAAPGFKPIAARAGTKTDILITELARGTTLSRLLILLSAERSGGRDWLPESVKVGFGYDVKRKGYGVRTEFVTDPAILARYDAEAAEAATLESLSSNGIVTPVAVYFIVYPEGVTAPVPATARKANVSEAA